MGGASASDESPVRKTLVPLPAGLGSVIRQSPDILDLINLAASDFEYVR